MNGPYALLDDRDATAERPSSRLYEGFVREHRCTDPSTLNAMWAAVDADLRSGLHAVLLIDYEWGAKLLRAGHQGLSAADRSALRLLMFATMKKLGRDAVDVWLERRATVEPPGACGVMDLQPSVDKSAFVDAIARIHQAIAAGETYQVNYTYRLDGAVYGSPVALYRQLRVRQPVSYGALIELPADADPEATTHVLSCSPELFLRHHDGLLTARPMKGTAARSRPAEGDSETARWLSEDIKNRAENLMIVDLLRNDLGRVAETGSVKVPSLFAIEPYGTVFQMTSTVLARLKPNVGMPDLLRAVFPCGSITGAPKHHTMDLIAGLETTPRGLYCGAIGWMDAPAGGASCGSFCLSVAIRTLTLRTEQRGRHPVRLVRMGVGAGIVQDSRADDEHEECRLKARFLTGLDPGFELFETMRVEAGEVRHVGRHLVRIGRSATALGFAFDREAVVDELNELIDSLPPETTHRVRLALRHDGRRAWTHAVLADLPDGSAGPVSLILADLLLTPTPLAAHKTTLRAIYDDGVRAAERQGAFDSLFLDVDGRVIEGGRSSVFVRLDGRWWTPPVADGALTGIMRGALLDDPAWAAGERSLRLADLHRAEGLVVCNALRGVLTAQLRVPTTA